MTKACVRCAMGASMLSTMLLIGSSAAIAAADPDSASGSPSGSAGQNQSTDSAGTDGQSPGTGNAGTPARPRFDLRTSIRQSVVGVRTVLGPQSAQRPQSGAAAPELTGSPASTGESGTEPVAVAPEPASALPSGTSPLLTAPTGGTSNASALGGPRAKVAPVKAPLAFDQLPSVAHTLGNTVASVLTSTQQTVAAVPTLLVGLPTSATPVSDVISTIEFMLTSVSGSVGAIVALPGELGTLMGVGVGTPPVSVVVAGPEARPMALAGPVDLPGLLLPQLPAASLGSGAVFAEPAAPVLAPVTPASAERMAPITEVPLGMSGLTASGAPESFLDRAVSTLLVPLSIATLAAVALPGVGGLLVICALGVRIGYRQAKAGWAVRVTGISRFAGSGPLGVVRSGSMVTLHVPRGTRVRKAGELRLVDRSVEQAA